MLRRSVGRGKRSDNRNLGFIKDQDWALLVSRLRMINGPSALTSPAPKVMMRSPLVAIRETASTTTGIDGSYETWDLSILLAIRLEVTPAIGCSLAAYTSNK